MIGSDKQKEWAEKALNRCHAGLDKLAESIKGPDDKYNDVLDYMGAMYAELAAERRSWIIINAIGSMSDDPAKAKKQLIYMYYNREEKQNND